MNAGRAAAFSTLLVLQACAEATAPPSTAAGPVAVHEVDIALATPEFARWLAAHPARIWSATSLHWADGAWRIEIRSTIGSSATLAVDGGSGTITVLDLGR